MSDRKGINKHYGNDYEPLKYEKKLKNQNKRLKNGVMTSLSKSSIGIRLMTPFSIQCSQCNGYISKYKKFNGKKTEMDEKYLNKIKMYRLSIRCPTCNNHISFRTDPGSADYVMLEGGTRMSGVNVQETDEQEEPDRANATSVDDVLDRLLKEQMEEEEEEEENGNGKNNQSNNSNTNKLEELEDKLVNLQKEQERDLELELLKKKIYLQNEMNNSTNGSNKNAKYIENLENEIFELEYRESTTLGSSEIGIESIPIKDEIRRVKINKNSDNKNNSNKKKKKKVIAI